MKKKYPLKYVIPIFLLIIAIVQVIVIASVDKLITDKEVIKRLIALSKTHTTIFAANIVQSNKNQDCNNHETMLSIFGTDPNIKKIIVMDNNNHVRFSFPKNLSKKNLADIYSKQLIELCNSSRLNFVYRYMIDRNAKSLYALTPFRESIAPGKIAASQLGIVLIEYDYKLYERIFHKNSYMIVFVVASTILIFTVFFILYFYKTVTLRVDNIVKLTNDFSNGKYLFQDEIKGNDELSIISRSFNNMVKEISESHEDLFNSKRELFESELRFRTIFDNIELIAVELDIYGNLQYVNPFLLELTGRTNTEVMNKSWFEIFIPEKERNQVENYFKKLREKRYEVLTNAENNIICKDGTLKYIRWSNAVIKDNSGKVKTIAAIGEDITNEIIENELILREQRLNSLGKLAGGIAHDFNNILAMIFGFIDLSLIIAKDREVKEIEKYLTKATTAFNRAEALTNQLLTFSKGGAPIKDNANIGEIIKDSVNFILSGSSILVNYIIPENLPKARVDRNQIAQVFENLAINAREATSNQGNINISIEFDEKDFYIKFKDNGSGISEEDMNNIFDPFFTTKDIGNGLGLSTVYSIIKNHGGLITVNSKLGEGTSFTIKLPYESSESNKINITNEVYIPSKKPLKSILLLDDEELILDFLKNTFEKKDFVVDTASKSQLAIEFFKKSINKNNPYDVILIDLTIPGDKAGSAVALEMLKLDPHANIFVTSGYINDPVMINPKAYGFMGALQKPFTFKSVSDFIDKL